MAEVKHISLKEKIGKGYGTYWNNTKRYNVVKGGRGSKKSTTTAMKIIFKMMKYPLANTLVVRRFFNTHKDSTWTQLKWATHNLGVAHLWKFSKSPLEATYIPTGQKILFRGMDDPQSITSITVEVGFLCWAWFEEAFQITDEDAFNKVDMSIRGEMPDGYYKQLNITFNPWSENSWLKSRFFDKPDEDTFVDTTTYFDNEFLGKDDIKVFEKMKLQNPRRYSIEGLGNWGIAEGLVYENWKQEEFNINEVKSNPNYLHRCGLDFGFTNDPTAFVNAFVDQENEIIYITDEIYQTGLVNQEIADEVLKIVDANVDITADSAEPKSIEELRRAGLYGIHPAKKGKDSIQFGIQRLQSYAIKVHPRCMNIIVELNNYVWSKDKDGKQINKPIDDYNHALDALRYLSEGLKDNNKIQSFDIRSLGL